MFKIKVLGEKRENDEAKTDFKNEFIHYLHFVYGLNYGWVLS